MKINKLKVLVVLLVCFVTLSHAQKGNYRISNGFSIYGGVTQFDITTSNFETTQGSGFLGALSAKVDLPLKWYNVSVGMQFSENSLGILGRPTQTSSQNIFIDYKLLAVQAAFLMHIKVVKQYFTVDLGPSLQYNAELELKDKDQELYVINNYTNLNANSITKISPFNFNGIIGASLGIKHFKLRAQYIYGFTNILKKLEKEGLDTSGGSSRFEGNQSMLVLGAMIAF